MLQSLILDRKNPSNAMRLILFDTEYTAWEGSQQRRWSEPWEHREIIQIAALKVALGQDCRETACFDRLVSPRLNPLLSVYITGLTGITQAAVDAGGVSFASAYRDFYHFSEQGRLPMFSWGDDPGVLRENCGLAGQPLGDYPAGFHDIRDVLEAAGIDTRPYSSGTVYQALGLAFPHASHNALNDVRSLCVTLNELSRRRGARDIEKIILPFLPVDMAPTTAVPSEPDT